ncbi:MAG: Crp/Fnr family transcriptional regulator [Ruminococcaceae bacterium]|nr:Crp/Fnr family transcriptional regulator [Oscillospiraceae bacterium]
MKKGLDVLKRCALFTGIRLEDIDTMLGCLGATVVNYGKKERIMSEGEQTGKIGIVLSGCAQIEQVDFYGNRSIMARVLPSELFGESFACAELKQLPVDVIAAENTEIMLLDCSKIMASCCKSCEFHNRMIANLLKIVSDKNLFFYQKIEVISQRTTREKLMTYLLLQAKKFHSDRFTIPFDRQELADFLGVDRSGLSAEISKLRAEGVLECQKARFRLL